MVLLVLAWLILIGLIGGGLIGSGILVGLVLRRRLTHGLALRGVWLDLERHFGGRLVRGRVPGHSLRSGLERQSNRKRRSHGNGRKAVETSHANDPSVGMR
ncbi:hypothetical protein ABMA46_12365 [Mesorhizobium sp. CN5-321]